MNDMTPMAARAEAAPALRAAARFFPETDRVLRIWQFLSIALPDTSGILFRHKTTSLRVAELTQPGPDGAIDRGAVTAQIALLKGEAMQRSGAHEWSAAGEIEQLQIALMDLPTMQVELRRYLADARRIGLTNLPEFEKLAVEAGDDERMLRAVLLRLAADVQQRFRKLHIYREYVAAYTARVSLLFFAAAVSFVGLLFVLTWCEAAARSSLEAAAGAGAVDYVLDWRRSLGPVALALAAGLFGAAFSMMSQTRKRIEVSTLDDMRTNARFVMLLFRLCVGVGAAMILYYVFDSGVLGDSRNFPEPQQARITVATLGDGPFDVVGVLSANRELSLLLVWCFVAGFSEVLVPSILRRTEGVVEEGARKV